MGRDRFAEAERVSGPTPSEVKSVWVDLSQAAVQSPACNPRSARGLPALFDNVR